MTIYLVVLEDTGEALAAFPNSDRAETYRWAYNSASIFGGQVTVREMEMSN